MRQRKRENRFRLTIKPKTIAIVLAIIAALAVCGAIGLALLANTSAFTIASIDTEPTEHVSSEDIATLAGVPAGTTLLNYDEASIVANLKRNPWIGEVTIQRTFPDRLRIQVKERGVRALVMMNAGAVVWCLGDDNVWIEPLKVESERGQSLAEAALAKSRAMGALLVTDVPQSVEPVAGEPADDEVFSALATFYKELSDEFWAEVVSFSAPSAESVACILKNGVEVSLGAAANIQTKETLVKQLLDKYPNRLTYINVRVPSNPSYRMVGSEQVQEGTGALGDIPGATTTHQPQQGQQGAAQGSDGQGQSAEGTTQDGTSATATEGDPYGEEGYAGDEGYVDGGESEYEGSEDYVVYDSSANGSGSVDGGGYTDAEGYAQDGSAESTTSEGEWE